MVKTETKVFGNTQIAFRTGGIRVDPNDRFIGVPDFGGAQKECTVAAGSENDVGPVYQVIGVVHSLHFFGLHAASF